jgi:hypothetical protein
MDLEKILLLYLVLNGKEKLEFRIYKYNLELSDLNSLAVWKG